MPVVLRLTLCVGWRGRGLPLVVRPLFVMMVGRPRGHRPRLLLRAGACDEVAPRLYAGLLSRDERPQLCGHHHRIPHALCVFFLSGL